MGESDSKSQRRYSWAALVLGILAAATLYTAVNPVPENEFASIKDRIVAQCLGRRSKAQRLAYWKERVGLDAGPLSVDYDGGDTRTASVTFSHDIAPILFEHCAQCHRPGEVAPFSVLTYKDVLPWAWLIGIVTENRYMPPWPPGSNSDVAFKGSRILPDEDIVLIRQWLDQGAAQGDPSELPPLPTTNDGWSLGQPDLIVSLPIPYSLPAATDAQRGDVYRNLVLPIPITQSQWVEAVEIRPGNKRVVHHAILQIDQLQAGRRLDAIEPGPGFSGMDMGSTENPGGHFIGWAPGKTAQKMPEGMPWPIAPGTDLILQLHMLPTVHPAQVNPQIGLYFTDKPARYQPFGLVLRNGQIDIAPGERHYIVEQFVTTPVDLTVLSIFPHAHYLGRDVKTTATLPDGEQLTLVHIKDWDFGWQDEYRFENPVHLPAGTKLSMRFSYDNSADNPRNPHHPPRRVVAGNRSTDEMAIVVLQVLTDHPEDELRVREAMARRLIETNPNGWFSHNLLGIALRAQGNIEEAIKHFYAADRLNPDHTDVIFNLGNAFQSKGDFTEAIGFYHRVLMLEPAHPKVHNNLAIALQSQGEIGPAVEHFRAQLDLSPTNPRALYNLATALVEASLSQEALGHLTTALSLDPQLRPAKLALADLQRRQNRFREAQAHYMDLLDSDPEDAEAYFGKARVHLDAGENQHAIKNVERALSLDPALMVYVNNLAWDLATREEKNPLHATQAVMLAQLIDQATQHNIPEVLDTLAAAHAATGNFDKARIIIKKALNLVGPNHAYSAQFDHRLSLYEQGKAFVSSGG